jgi:hypothetical protein
MLVEPSILTVVPLGTVVGGAKVVLGTAVDEVAGTDGLGGFEV